MSSKSAPRPALNDNELVMLSLAADGESVMAIGGWEKAVKRLTALGYLTAADKFNHFITSAGRERWEEEEYAEMKAIIGWNNQMVDSREEESDDAAGDAKRLQ